MFVASITVCGCWSNEQACDNGDYLMFLGIIVLPSCLGSGVSMLIKKINKIRNRVKIHNILKLVYHLIMGYYNLQLIFFFNNPCVR